MSNVADVRALPVQMPRAQVAAYRRPHFVRRAGLAVAFLVVLAFAIVFVAPIYWMSVTSLKTTAEVFQLPPVWWPAKLQWSNYPDALQVFPFVLYATNTLRIAVPVAIGTTFSSALVAYGFSRLALAGSRPRLLSGSGDLDDPDLGDVGSAVHPLQ